jgi:hypothetical protein
MHDGWLNQLVRRLNQHNERLQPAKLGADARLICLRLPCLGSSAVDDASRDGQPLGGRQELGKAAAGQYMQARRLADYLRPSRPSDWALGLDN